MKVRHVLRSLASHIPPTAPPSRSTLTMITVAASFSRNAWVRRLRPIPLERNSRATSSESTAALTRMASL